MNWVFPIYTYNTSTRRHMDLSRIIFSSALPMMAEYMPTPITSTRFYHQSTVFFSFISILPEVYAESLRRFDPSGSIALGRS
jgi:hypothetical protein